MACRHQGVEGQLVGKEREEEPHYIRIAMDNLATCNNLLLLRR